MVNILDYSKTLKEYVSRLNSQSKNIYITSVADEAKSSVISSIIKLSASKSPKLIICPNDDIASKLNEDISAYLKNVYLYPARDLLFAYASVDGPVTSSARFDIIEKIKNKKDIIVIAGVDSIAEKIISKSDFDNSKIEINVNQNITQEEFLNKLINIKYKRTYEVSTYGEYAVRGGIVDVFSNSCDMPYRIEFAFDTIESIRRYNLETKRSIDNIESAIIFPASEDFSISLHKESLCEYFDNSSLIFIENPSRVIERYDAIFEMLPDNLLNLDGDASRSIASKENINNLEIDYDDEKTIHPVEIYSKEEFLDILNYKNNKVFLSSFDDDIYDTFGDNIIKTPMPIGSNNILKGNFEHFIFSLNNLLKDNYFGLIIVNSLTRAYRLYEELNEKKIKSKVLENSAYELDFEKEFENREFSLFIVIGNFEEGFKYDDEKLFVICENDIYGTNITNTLKINKLKKKKNENIILNLSDLKLGDYVVHENYGIGVYRGSKYISIDDVTKEYIEIEYADDGKIFLPISSMDLIQKYRSDDDEIAPKLNKIGSSRWDETKRKVKKELELIANDLVLLYAKRQNSKGYAFSEDSSWQKEFEETFQFEETSDQLVAIENTKADMESSKPMDRLICGDVGFGKTEVAIRAAFKAVLDQKQVAYLVPTTVLCQQHYNTFVSRMVSFPVRVDYLSGFKSISENKKTLEKLERGEIDIIIGTHRLLSSDVKFYDIGLLIIDEEQRFGVTHKEKIKELKNGIDVLTLSATPIPRTLHMSLIGIKDMSILKDPPVNRKPVSTFIMEYNDEIVRSAIERELARKGQVFYVHNRVQDILDVAHKIKNLVPNANVMVAHGQMNKAQLDKIMLSFINKEIDVLVVTTIIETGIDIQNANTLIVDDANRYGLSQLYQLRGRVGRSSTKANAFFMYRKGLKLNEQSEFKLKSIKNYNSLGSGINIARKDLELRGAGTILGRVQHGHFNYIGYEMYYKLLTKAIEDVKTNNKEEEYQTSIDVDINAFIPNEYIENENLKLNYYKKIASCKNPSDVDDLRDEMIDRFGALPKEVESLLLVERLKIFAHSLYIMEVRITTQRIHLKFIKDAKINLEKLKALVENNIGHVRVLSSTEPEINYINYGDISIKESFDKCFDLLKELE